MLLNLTIFDYCYILQSPNRERRSKEILPCRQRKNREPETASRRKAH